MGFTKLTSFSKKPGDFPDVPSPSMTSDDIRSYWETPLDELMGNQNGLIDGLTANTGAGNLGAKDVSGNTSNVQAEMNKANNGLNSHKTATTLDHPDKSVVESKLGDASVSRRTIQAGAVGTSELDPAIMSQPNTLVGAQAQLQQVNEQLAENPTHMTQLDVFTDSTKTVIDGTKLTNILNTISASTVFLPDGTYSLNSTIAITSDVSLLLSAGAVIQASVSITDMIVYNNGNTDGGKNRFIRGGVLDGNGLANNCLTITNSAHLCLDGIIFKNPINKGLNVSAGYELLGRNLFFNNTITSNITSNIGIYLNTSDAMFEQIVITNYTTGIEVTQAGNFFSDVHIWCSQSARTPSTVGINNQAVGNMFDRIYFDTLATGLLTNHRTFLKGCLFNFGNTFYQYLSSAPVYINNNVADFTVVENCFFEFTSRSGYTDTVTIVASTNSNYIVWRNCDFATPTVFTNQPPKLSNRSPKAFKIQITSTLPTIQPGTYQEKDITITDPTISIDPRDTVIFNTLGYVEPGIVLTLAMKSANVIKFRMWNTTTAAITTTMNTFYVTVFQNTDGTKFDYTSPTVTGN